jgi:AcrR family transcriptional regulator
VTAAARRREPTQARAREKVARIVRAARRVLEREGPEALNTNRIAAEAGVGVGTVYEYFPDKHAVAAAVREQLADHEAREVLRCLDAWEGRPLEEALTPVVETVFALYRRHHALYRALWALAPSGRLVGERPGELLIQQRMRRWLEPRAADLGLTDLDLTVLTVFHLVESLAMQMGTRGGKRSDAACVEQIVRAARGYLGLGPARSRPVPSRAARPTGSLRAARRRSGTP